MYSEYDNRLLLSNNLSIFLQNAKSLSNLKKTEKRAKNNNKHSQQAAMLHYLHVATSTIIDI